MEDNISDDKAKLNNSNKDKNNNINPTNNINREIQDIIENINKNVIKDYQLEIFGKRLYYLSTEGEVLYFLLEINPDTDINPFDESILIDLQFIPNKKPLLKFKKNFLEPSFCDNRNFFDCFFTRDFIYKNNDINKVEKILEEIIKVGIKNFLFCLKENIQFNTFIFYGDYELNEIYNINDFLENSNTIKFYRVNHVYNSEIEEKYIILTDLYFLIFIPQENNKSFAKLIFKELLRDINFIHKKIFNKKIKRNTLKLILQELNTPVDSTYEIELFFINRICPELTETHNEDNFFVENCKKLKDDIEKKQQKISFNKYSSVIVNSKRLFKAKGNEKNDLSEIEFKNRIIDYEKLFQFSEKVYNYYNELNEKDKKKYKDRMDFYIIAINFLGAELMTFFDKEKANFNFYYDKVKSILNENEKNQ